MATSLTLNFRCSTKNLTSIPATGETPASDAVNVNLQEVTLAPGFPPRSTLSVTLAMAADTFIMGGYYTVTVIDGVAPGGTSIPCPDPAQAPPSPAPKAAAHPAK
jgi:hypothetical protein